LVRKLQLQRFHLVELQHPLSVLQPQLLVQHLQQHLRSEQPHLHCLELQLLRLQQEEALLSDNQAEL
jgi:hypothetical protein